MSDVTLSYKGSDILELSDSGSATLKTGGTYCEADIEVEYVKPSGTDHTVISAVTIPNGTVNGFGYGYKNGVIFNTKNPMAKVEVLYKKITSKANNIYLCAVPQDSIEQTSPYINGREVNGGGTLVTNETIDGFFHYIFNLSWSQTRFKLGSWSDSTYSNANAFKLFRAWDSSDNLIIDLVPVLKNGKALFYDNVTGLYYDNWTGYGLIQGEAVIA